MTTSDPNVPPPGLVAGKYELLRLIGRGGMGSVWEGRHASLGTSVAIKFIEAEYANSQDARQRFDNEARAAATIQSKHAIQIYDHGLTDDGRPYIVMEMLVGEPLDERLKKMTRLPAYDTARMIQQVCRALHRAHEHGIIHRDLKPENIFLVRSPDDDEEHAKVLDFGIAKIKSTPGAVGVSSATKTGTLLGTPFFMSPEQARGLRNVDHRSDLWALGVIVFRCITGVLPFDGESLGDLLVKICTIEVPVPSHVTPGLPPSFDAWMVRALDRDPDKRFQTANELAEALAYSCGVSMKRVPDSRASSSDALFQVAQSQSRSSPGLPRTEPMTASQARAAGFTPGSAAFGQPLASATSAPLTASSPRRQSSSKGLIVLALGAMTVGSVVAALVLSRMSGKPPAAAAGLADERPASVVPLPVASAPTPVVPAPGPSASSAQGTSLATLTPPPHGKTPLPSPPPANKLPKQGKTPLAVAPAAGMAPAGMAPAGMAPAGMAPPPAPGGMAPAPPTQKPPSAQSDPGY